MLDVVYYPVSAILWFWHTVVGGLLGPASGVAWALAVVLLVATLRTLLLAPAVAQMRSMRRMQRIAPQVRALQEEHAHDRRALAEQTQRLQREHGVNPLGGCLPALVQVPVFLGLLQVLKGFQPTYPDNYVFGRADILSFLDARVLGATLSESLAGGAQALGHISLTNPVLAPHVLPLAVPLILVAALATYVNARLARARQVATADPAAPAAETVARLSVWVFPAGIVLVGPFFPVAMLLYWVTNNCWTLAQQYLVGRRLDREEVGASREGSGTTGRGQHS